MENALTSFFRKNLPRKLAALIAAIILWLFINQTITDTKTIPGIPIRVINLPINKTIEGLLPNGMLEKRLTLTLTGTKHIMESLEPGDIEVILDATNVPDEWMVQISKKNLVSLNPDINLQRHITQIAHQEFILYLSKMVTVKIPVTIQEPTGRPPVGYQLLDVWPKHLEHTLSGPEEKMMQLQAQGIDLTFNLNEINKEQLKPLTDSSKNRYEDEVTFIVPDAWKMISIPFVHDTNQMINDKEAALLRIDFHKKEYILMNQSIPVRLFFPLKTATSLNPETISLKENELIHLQEGLARLAIPLYVYEVSHLFFDIVKDYMEITITAVDNSRNENLNWSIEYMQSRILEDRFVSILAKRHKLADQLGSRNYQDRESQWRNRFRTYMQKLILYKAPNDKLRLINKLSDSQIIVEELH